MKKLLFVLILMTSFAASAAVDNEEVVFMKENLGPGCFAEYVKVAGSNDGEIVVISKACGFEIDLARNDYNANVRKELTTKESIDGASENEVSWLCELRIKAGANSCEQKGSALYTKWPVFR